METQRFITHVTENKIREIREEGLTIKQAKL